MKPIVYGAATGIAVASFSGLGAGYDGFKPAYFRGLGEALLANILFQGGLFFAARLEGTTGAVVGLVWGALIAAALVVRLRYLLHFAVLEAALEAAAPAVRPQGHRPRDGVLPVVRDAAARRARTSASPAARRSGPAARSPGPATGPTTRRTGAGRERAAVAPAPAKPSLAPTPAGVAPQDNKKTALVVGAVAATILLAGVVGQAVAAAAADEEQRRPARIELDTQVGSGPTTDPAPDPVDPPGPTPDASQTPSTESSSTQSELHDARAGRRQRAGRAGRRLGPGPGPDLEPDRRRGRRVPDRRRHVDRRRRRPRRRDRLPAARRLQVEQQGDGFAMVFGDGGHFFALLTPAPTDISAMITDHLTGCRAWASRTSRSASRSASSCRRRRWSRRVTLGYQGLLASQQGGTVPVEGFALLLRDSRTAPASRRSACTSRARSRGSPLVEGYNEMLNSLVSTL